MTVRMHTKQERFQVLREDIHGGDNLMCGGRLFQAQGAMMENVRSWSFDRMSTWHSELQRRIKTYSHNARSSTTA